MSDQASPDRKQRVPQESLLFEQVLEKDNLNRAWKRVRANKGAPGMDKMTVGAFPAFARDHIGWIVEKLRAGTYRPAPVLRVWIPKPDGRQRPLGIPTVLDRVIQQGIAQILGPIFEADFSDQSYGFRFGRRAQDAVEKLLEYAGQGYVWAVDCDLQSFFDTVNHDILMYRIGRKVRDKALLRLIGKYLRAGVIDDKGRKEKSECGVPQGGPLSPLLANIMLDPLDREIEALGLPFVRYADDFLILAKSREEAEAALEQVRKFIEGKLKLLINPDKTKVAPLKECEFLGFRVESGRIIRSERSARRFKYRIKEILSRSRGVSMRQRLTELRQYSVGWFHYFKIGLRYGELRQWDQWLRRLIRLCYWKDWRRPRKRRAMLMRLGIDRDRVKLASRSRKGYWRMSSNSIVQQALANQWLVDQGFVPLSPLWCSYKYGNRIPSGCR